MSYIAFVLFRKVKQMEFCLPQLEVKVCDSFSVVDSAVSAKGRSGHLWSLCFGVSDVDRFLN